ncbi:minor tail protein [Stenotrophomonas phage vB_Sm_QDWS359]|uniref:Minor tail protein n=1 Tax=Stenotrophomonas phage vB_Sm_QDWS359 TaxID=2943841 RepID=A0A9E7DKY5_9CAUD|nr:minor tail protein [Stenotrophomonas phage vB_Sm_QDWS359]UQM93923.1 minor tail protein [Stenotrophomonas phage vB_Sm_QDWS359]
MPDVKLSQLAATSPASKSAGDALWAALPPTSRNANYTLVLADAFTTVLRDSGAGDFTYTVPPNSTAAFPLGTVIAVADTLASTAVTIAPGAGVTLRYGGVTGSYVLQAGSAVLLLKVATNTWLVIGEASSGVYTPALTNGANVASSTAYAIQWSRVGNVVTVSGRVDVTPTAAADTTTRVDVALPVPSNMVNTFEASGAGSAGFRPVVVSADATNDRIILQFQAASTSSTVLSFTATYLVK